MDVTRRDFLTLIAIAGGLAAASPEALARALEPERLLEFAALGNVTLLHMTDPHGTLLPVHYREPDMRIGAGDEAGQPPFVSGEAFLKAYGIGRVKGRRGDRETGGRCAGDFVCHNCNGLKWDDPVFAPYTIEEVGGVRVGVSGQAFPYVPVSHPQRFVRGLTFGIQEDHAQKL